MIKLMVFLHIAAGAVACAGMIGAIAFRKGGLWHRRTGKLYTFAMAIALLLAVVVSLLTSNYFLFLIALFSGYFVFTGWRLAHARDGIRTTLDHAASQLMIAFAVAMIGYGIYLFAGGQTLGVALAVFGVFAWQPAWLDYKRGKQWPTGKDRIVLHLNRMGGASIATLTAVFVVNIQTSPAFVAWLLPTMVGTPMIIYWTRRTQQPPANL